jgi:hypothetical protein
MVSPLPALAAIRHDERFKAVYVRLVRKHGIKMKATIAVQRNCLTIFVTKKKYDNNYFKNQLAVKTGEEYPTAA